MHEAFAGTVTLIRNPASSSTPPLPPPLRSCRPSTSWRARTSSGFPAIGHGTRSKARFSGSAESGGTCRPAGNGFPAIGIPSRTTDSNGSPAIGRIHGSTQVSYLPAPPRSIESGPSIAADSTDQLWLPGSWVYHQNNYAWRSGYWSAPRENWVYVPATYIWTPRGYIFVDGYWDYDIPRRGVVFAPVYFHRPVYAVAGYRYSPSLVISLSLFTDHLFLRPSYRHYYFGDYYASGYRTRGYYSCFNYHNSRRGYEPVYAYNRWSHRNDRNWERDYRSRYENLSDRESARPPRTWAAMQSRPEYRESSRALAAPIGQYARNREATGGQRFRDVDRPARERIAAQTREVRSFRNERQKTEGSVGRTAHTPDRVLNVERSRSPIASRERATGPETSRVRPDARTPGRSAPPAVAPAAREPERSAGEAVRPTRGPERTGPPSARPVPTQREARPERVAPPQRGSETPRAVPQPAAPKRPVLPSTAAAHLATAATVATPTPQRVQPPQRTQPTPQRVVPPQRSQPTPQRVAPPQRSQPTPQRVAPPQRSQPTPQRVAPPQRSQPTPQRVAPPQRSQPTPQRVAPPQRSQPTPQRVAPPQRSQPTPQRVAPRNVRNRHPGAKQHPSAWKAAGVKSAATGAEGNTG